MHTTHGGVNITLRTKPLRISTGKRGQIGVAGNHASYEIQIVSDSTIAIPGDPTTNPGNWTNISNLENDEKAYFTAIAEIREDANSGATSTPTADAWAIIPAAAALTQAELLLAVEAFFESEPALVIDNVTGLQTALDSKATLTALAAHITAFTTHTSDDVAHLSSDEHAKLTGVAAGAEVNVKSDFDATSGDAQILNKPTTITTDQADEITANTAKRTYPSDDETKLSNIEDNSTADQDASEIRTLVGSATDSNVFDDVDKTKVDNLQSFATSTTVEVPESQIPSSIARDTEIPTVNNSTTTFRINDTDVGTITANQSSNKTVDFGTIQSGSGSNAPDVPTEILTDTEQHYVLQVKDVDGTETTTWVIDKSVDELDESRSYQISELAVWGGRIYECIVATSPGEDPTDTPDSWLQQSFSEGELSNLGFVKRANIGMYEIIAGDATSFHNTFALHNDANTNSLIGYFNNTQASANLEITVQKVGGTLALDGLDLSLEFGNKIVTLSLDERTGSYVLSETLPVGNLLLRVGKDTAGSLSIDLTIIANHANEIRVSTATKTYLDDNYIDSDELETAISNVHNIVNITNNTIVDDAVEYVAYTVYATGTEVRFNTIHFAIRNSNSPYSFHGAWVQPGPGELYTRGERVTYNNQYWICIIDQGNGDEGVPGVVVDGNGFELWALHNEDPANHANTWDYQGSLSGLPPQVAGDTGKFLRAEGDHATSWENVYTWESYIIGGIQGDTDSTESNGSITTPIQFGGSGKYVYWNSVDDDDDGTVYAELTANIGNPTGLVYDNSVITNTILAVKGG